MGSSLLFSCCARYGGREVVVVVLPALPKSNGLLPVDNNPLPLPSPLLLRKLLLHASVKSKRGFQASGSLLRAWLHRG